MSGDTVSQQITNVSLEALMQTHHLFKQLGESGKDDVQKNQHGDIAMRMDISAEETIAQVLRQHKAPFRLISEELGETFITDEPVYTAIADGIDGSAQYKQYRLTGRYGTLLSVFSGLDPTYDDCVFAGCMHHSTGSLYYATAEGSFVIRNGKTTPLETIGVSQLSNSIPICIDEYFPINVETFKQKLHGFNTQYYLSSAGYYTSLLDGTAQLVLECTRKRNLELATFYLLVTKAGGVMLDLDGDDIGPRKYWEFGQREHICVVTAATKELGLALLAHIKNA